GAEGEQAIRRQAAHWRAEFGWSEQLVDHLLHRYGSLLTELIGMIRQDASLGRPLADAPAYLRAEIAYAASHEGALHLEDVMYLRTRINYEYADRGLAAVEEIATLAGDVLGWDSARREREIASYRAQAAAEERAAREPDDQSAERAREQAPDLTPMLPMGTGT